MPRRWGGGGVSNKNTTKYSVPGGGGRGEGERGGKYVTLHPFPKKIIQVDQGLWYINVHR